jgi:lysophospholipase L1-like esterase
MYQVTFVIRHWLQEKCERMRRLARLPLGKITRRSLEAAAADTPQIALPAVRTASPAALAAGLLGSFALLPVAWAQGRATRRRVPCLPPAEPPHHGVVPGVGEPVRLVAIGESPVAGIGLSCSDETVAAATARALGRVTGKPIVWRAYGLSGATVRDAMERVLPRVAPEPADLLIVAFGVNDATAYRSPARYADDLAALVTAARSRVGDAAVVIGGVASLRSFPALPWPLRNILGWRSVALQAAADRLTDRLPRLVVERFSMPLGPELFASDGFHPNLKAHTLWGEEIAALALPLIDARRASPLVVPSRPSLGAESTGRSPTTSRLTTEARILFTQRQAPCQPEHREIEPDERHEPGIRRDKTFHHQSRTDRDRLADHQACDEDKQ